MKRDEKSDAALVVRVPEKELKITATPSSDGTNSCAFLSLGIIDALINNGFIDNTQNPLSQEHQISWTTFQNNLINTEP